MSIATYYDEPIFSRTAETSERATGYSVYRVIDRLIQTGATQTSSPWSLHSIPTATVYSPNKIEELLYKAVEYVDQSANLLLPIDPELDRLVDTIVNESLARQEVSPLTRTV